MANDYHYNDMLGMQEQAVERARQMQRMEQRAAQRAKEDFSRRAQPPPAENNHPDTASAERQAAAQPKRTPMPVDYLHNGHTQAPQQTAEKPSTPQPMPPMPQEPRPSTPQQHTILGGDNDSAMLLALILLLSRESADPHLMLALMYIMM